MPRRPLPCFAIQCLEFSTANASASTLPRVEETDFHNDYNGNTGINTIAHESHLGMDMLVQVHDDGTLSGANMPVASASLAGLTPMLRSLKRTHKPNNEGLKPPESRGGNKANQVALTERDVESIAAGLFQFQF